MVLQLCHTSLQGGHQGVTGTYERIRAMYYWDGMYSDVKECVNTCADCNTSRGAVPVETPSPGNITADYPFHTIGMNHAVAMPKSFRNNTVLCVGFAGLQATLYAKRYPIKKRIR